MKIAVYRISRMKKGYVVRILSEENSQDLIFTHLPSSSPICRDAEPKACAALILILGT